MRYPIDIAAFIADQRAKNGENAKAEAVYRVYIPLVNEAYRAGRAGEPGWPVDPTEAVAEYKKARGFIAPDIERLTVAYLHWANAAYAQGLRDTKEGQ